MNYPDLSGVPHATFLHRVRAASL
ncbi:hypothetical protein VARIO8X_110139 [Burkholderiales bacterium 8X]|nr:hypothetical protein VARIO8X_110139 [Burkholderiales bacterium 8X]